MFKLRRGGSDVNGRPEGLEFDPQSGTELIGALFDASPKIVERPLASSFSKVNEMVEKIDFCELFPDAAPGFHGIAANLASLTPTKIIKTPDSEPIVREVLGPHLEVEFEEEAEKHIEAISNNINILVMARRALTHAAVAISANTGSGKISNESKFALAEIMSDFDEKTAPDEDKGAVWTLAFSTMAVDEEYRIMDKIIDDLERGEMDSQIAKKLVVEALSDVPKKATDQRNSIVINSMLDFALYLKGKNKVDKELFEDITSEEALGLWPPTARQLITARRESMKEHIEAEITISKATLERKGIKASNANKTSLEDQVRRFYEKLDKRRRSSEGMARIIKRKRLPRAAEDEQLTTDTQPEEEKANNSMLTRDSNGELVTISPEDIVAMAEEIFDGYDKNLKEDMIKAFDYLRTTDLSHPEGRGMKKLKHQVKKNNNGKSLWEFKASAASGFETSTKKTKDLRIIFSLGEDQIVVHGVVRRDMLDRGIRAIHDRMKLH